MWGATVSPALQLPDLSCSPPWKKIGGYPHNSHLSLKIQKLEMDQAVSAITSWSCTLEIKPSIKGCICSSKNSKRIKGLYDRVQKSPGQTPANPIYTLQYKVLLKSHFPQFHPLFNKVFFFFSFLIWWASHQENIGWLEHEFYCSTLCEGTGPSKVWWEGWVQLDEWKRRKAKTTENLPQKTKSAAQFLFLGFKVNALDQLLAWQMSES